MSPSVCPSCRRRKGRRTCPALHASICTTCCGTKRLTEIPCPSDCGYLVTARAYPPAVVQRRQEREARLLAPLLHDLTPRQHRLFLFIQSVVGRHRPASLPPLQDVDVADAVAALAATIETERRGIIYEHRATSLPAQRLEADLKAALDGQRAQAAGSFDRDLVVVLRRTERAARHARDTLGEGQTVYLDFLERLLRDLASQPGPTATEAPAGDTAPGLIIP